MGAERYELSEGQWGRIAPLLPGKAGDPGRGGGDNRLFVNGCLWVLRSGAHWQHLPERYGKWKTAHRRFSQYLMLDSTIVRAHQQAAGGKEGPRTRRWGVPEAD